ncbi:GTPase [Aureliella helgolandensis]|uniref:GTPase Obg n=1 Tax=Aureliella helgolandensis TaxID=2527968 RepID=A0A518GH99_9BACT|nr:GTPase [Aureliella helgolandensis]QDV27950.1 GTPase Obg [Aureliella helgolandensis]
MPANLTAQYHRAEAAYRQAESSQEELDCLQWMLRELPKHKGTDRLQADLKTKIARAKLDVQREATAPAAGKPPKIPKQGAGRVLLVGAPNSGKSQLLAALTRATPEIANYPFTTLSPLPGMMLFEDCPFQLIDLPPITADFMEASVVGLVRGADLVFLVIDLASDHLIEDSQAIWERFSGGKTRLGRETYLDENDIGVSYTQTLVLLNKIEVPDAAERLDLLNEFWDIPFDCLEVSGMQGIGLEQVRRATFERLEVVRVYTKHPLQKQPDLTKPFAIRKGGTLLDVAANVHHEMARNLKFARVWGSAVHGGTTVKPDYQPQDGDVVELHA